MAVIPKPRFPDVPKLPGVPQLPRSPAFPPGPPPALGIISAVGKLLQSLAVGPQWGIFDKSGARVLAPDSILDFGYHNEWNLSTFPVQAGEFATYNKVSNPFDTSVRMSKAGSQADRTQFLSTLERIAASLDLYTIRTPERSYLNCNITRFEVSRRGPQGAYFLNDVDVFFKEIRQVTPQYTSTAAATQDAQDASAIPVTNQGLLQSQTWAGTWRVQDHPGVTP